MKNLNVCQDLQQTRLLESMKSRSRIVVEHDFIIFDVANIHHFGVKSINDTTPVATLIVLGSRVVAKFVPYINFRVDEFIYLLQFTILN